MSCKLKLNQVIDCCIWWYFGNVGVFFCSFCTLLLITIKDVQSRGYDQLATDCEHSVSGCYFDMRHFESNISHHFRNKTRATKTFRCTNFIFAHDDVHFWSFYVTDFEWFSFPNMLNWVNGFFVILLTACQQSVSVATDYLSVASRMCRVITELWKKWRCSRLKSGIPLSLPQNTHSTIIIRIIEIWEHSFVVSQTQNIFYCVSFKSLIFQSKCFLL